MDGAQLYIRNGLAQNDLDMNHFKLLNLDTSNLPPAGLPPTVVCPAHNWLDGWDVGSMTWNFSQPTFADIAGPITPQQQSGITTVGAIRIGQWIASIIGPGFVPSLESIRIPAGNVNLNNQRIANLADPVNAQDAVNLRFMDFMLQGLNPKQAVDFATTTSLILVGLTQPIDGQTLFEGARVLVKNQSSTRLFQNGIWIAHNTAWTRATDADHGSGDTGHNTGNDINRAYCVVLNGVANGGTSWFESVPVVTIGTDPVGFVQFSAGADVIAGNGLTQAGNTLNVGAGTGIQVNADSVQIDPAYAGQASITTLGTISAGTWNGSLIDPAHGGTGVANGTNTITLTQANLAVQKIGLAIPEASLVLQCGGGSNIITFPAIGTVATLAGSEVFTNKSIVPRVSVTPTSATPSFSSSLIDAFYITALGANITSVTDTGTPNRDQELEIWITDNGVARSIAWGSQWTASSDLPLPVITIPTKTLYTRFSWNPDINKWVLVSKLNNIS